MLNYRYEESLRQMTDELIHGHLRYAHAIAAMLARKYPSIITRAELEGAAEFGLVQAARSYDPTRNASFATFAYYRVRGAIVDEVRKTWRASNVGSEILTSISEDAEAAPYPAGDARSGDLLEYNSHSIVSLTSVLPGQHSVESVTDPREGPATQLLRKEELESVFNAIRELPCRHRFVLQAHYYDDLSLVNISRQLKLSKSRISRIHAQAISMVRSMLQNPRLGHTRNQTSTANARALIGRQLCVDYER